MACFLQYLVGVEVELGVDLLADKLVVSLGVVVVLVGHVLQSWGADHYTATSLELCTVGRDWSCFCSSEQLRSCSFTRGSLARLPHICILLKHLKCPDKLSISLSSLLAVILYSSS